MRARRFRFLFAALAACLAAVVSLRAQAPGGAAAQDEIVTAPVEVDGDTLFRVRGVTSLSCGRPAHGLIRDRIVALAEDSVGRDRTHPMVEGDGMTRIVAGGRRS